MLPAASRETPVFCPMCRKARPAGTSLCAHCGDRLEVQGYCPVCERRWLAAVGTACAKHDLPLEHEAQAPDAAVGAAARRWVTVFRCHHPAQAMGARLRLEAEGIPTFLDGERVGFEAAYNLATGGVRLQVPDAREREALHLLGLEGRDDRPPAASVASPWMWTLCGMAAAVALAVALCWR